MNIDNIEVIKILKEGEEFSYTFNEHYGTEIYFKKNKKDCYVRNQGDVYFYPDVGEAMRGYIDRMYRVAKMVKRVEKTIPLGNLRDIGGIKALIRAFDLVEWSEDYYREWQSMTKENKTSFLQNNKVSK